MKSDSMGGIIVTGSARGIGLAIAQTLAEAGYGLVIADIDENAGGKAVTGIGANGGRAIFFKVDVADRALCAAPLRRPLDRSDACRVG